MSRGSWVEPDEGLAGLIKCSKPMTATGNELLKQRPARVQFQWLRLAQITAKMVKACK
jgi:hypothetical protein